MSRLIDDNADNFKPNDVDALLRQAMQTRPEPRAVTDLAARAMAIARRTEAALPPIAVLSRVRWWNRVATAVAAVVIVAIAGWVFRANLSAGGFQPWSDAGVTSADTTTSASTASTTSAASSSNTTEWMFIGVGLAVTAVGILAAQRTIGGGDVEFILSARVLAGVEGSSHARR